jgi:hypothetical protein
MHAKDKVRRRKRKQSKNTPVSEKKVFLLQQQQHVPDRMLWKSQSDERQRYPDHVRKQNWHSVFY